MAGYAEIAAGVTHAFLFHPETGLRDIDTLNNVYSAAHGLNGRRQAVGVFFASPSEDDRPFLADAAGMRNLNDLLADANGWVLVEARGINDRGQIVGYGLHGGRERAFLLNPVAAPAGTDEPPAPRVRLVSPEPGARYEEPAAIPLQAEVEASGGVRRVVFRVNGARVGAVSNAPFALVWSNAPAAVCDLRAEAVDEQGRTGFSGRVRVVVGVAGSSPTNGAAPTAQAQPRPPGADAPDS